MRLCGWREQLNETNVSEVRRFSLVATVQGKGQERKKVVKDLDRAVEA